LQPKYIYNKHEAAIVGAEALVRWIDKEGKVKSPVDFIPVFEENGFILKLDQFMWESVCKLIRKWLDAGIKAVPISVNVSRTYLYKFDVVTYIKGLIDKYNVPIDLLQIEITETTESEETIQYAEKFKEAGFTLMMDDFGSGYSSLSMLKDMPFDVLKMDRSFLDECLDNEHGRTIVSHVISMSNDLELNIIAEGVETKEMADFLYDNGCDVSQGYYFSKPLPIEDFEALWMHSDNNRKFEEV
jgi:EAL domain-containing protein (putative c-di-GMP-specific phosphodiesterase class I)